MLQPIGESNGGYAATRKARARSLLFLRQKLVLICHLQKISTYGAYIQHARRGRGGRGEHRQAAAAAVAARLPFVWHPEQITAQCVFG